MTHRAWLLALVFLSIVAPCPADDWPVWRGPHLDGVSREKAAFPIKWSPSGPFRWKRKIPGSGHSSPIVFGDRVYVTTCIESSGERRLLCLDRLTGETFWNQLVLTSPLEKKHTLNSYASSTPATDGSRVWVTFLDAPKIRVFCYSKDGKLLWERSPGGFNSPHGFCSSPILYQDLVIVNCDQDNQEAFIAALDAKTGLERYRIDRPNRVRSYCVPLIVEAAGRTQMVLTGSKMVASYDPANGRPIWNIDGPTEQFVASVVYSNDTFFITGGYPERHILGIRPDGLGNVTESHIKWRTNRNTSYVPSPVAHRGLFFIVSDEGIASCYDPNGKRLWNERISRHTSSSLVAAGDLVYSLDDEGVTHVFKAAPTFGLVARNALGEPTYSTPALSNGQFFIRSSSHLYCIGPE